MLRGLRPGGAIRIAHYDIIDDVITGKLWEIENKKASIRWEDSAPTILGGT